MKKFKVLKEFNDIHTSKAYEVGSTHEVSDERFEEIQTNLAKHDSEFIQEVKVRKTKKKAETPVSEEEGA